jgi:glutathione peroxidase
MQDERIASSGRGLRRDARSLFVAVVAVVGFALLTLALATTAARAGSGPATGGLAGRVPPGDARRIGVAAGSPNGAESMGGNPEPGVPAAGVSAVVASTLYGFTLPDLDDKPVSLGAFRGKVLLLVNTASKCGFTPQYEGLEQLSKTYRERGLVVAGFPANNFRGQEPGSNAEIKSFCSMNYGVDFAMFGKISVKGEDIHPLYRWLTAKETNPGFAGDIQWNFTKFLVGREGKVIARFPSSVAPDSPELTAAVEKALGKG